MEVTGIDFYLKEKSGNTQLVFPIIPNEVNETSGANTIPFNVIKTGEKKMPRGEKATGWSWDGLFPGKGMKGYSFVNYGVASDWKEPKKLVSQLDKWKKNGTELTLVIGDILNVDVFVEVFNKKYFGAGHCRYSITLTKYPDITVTTSPAPAPKKTSSSSKSTKKGKITGSKVAFRKGPAKRYKRLGTLKKNTEVTIYATSGNWYKIKESGSSPDSKLKAGVTSGGSVNNADEWWICSSYVKVTSGTASKKKTTSKKRKSTKKKTGSSSSTPKKKYTGTLPKTGLTKTSNKTVCYNPTTGGTKYTGMTM